jgi:hypothetical protein
MHLSSTGTGRYQINTTYIGGIQSTSGTPATNAYVTLTDTNDLVYGLANGTSTYVLTSNGASLAPTWQVAPSALVSSVSGTTNQITVSPTTGATVVSLVSSPSITGTWTTSAGNLALPTTTSTAGQIKINGSTMLHTYGNNFFLDGAGNYTLTVGTAVNNLGAGGSCMQSLTIGNANTAYGVNSASVLTTGDHNCFYGSSSGSISFASGSYNSFYGASSGSSSITRGSYNSFFGATTGSLYSSNESSNILIGYGVGGTIGESNRLRIGKATGTGTGEINATYIAGITGITVTGTAVLVSTANQLGIAVSSAKYKKDIIDMPDMSSVIDKLRPVTFHYKDEKQSAQLNYGLIAEEVEKVLPEMVAYDKDGQISTLYYQFLAPILLKEVQNLRKELEELKNRQ